MHIVVSNYQATLYFAITAASQLPPPHLLILRRKRPGQGTRRLLFLLYSLSTSRLHHRLRVCGSRRELPASLLSLRQRPDNHMPRRGERHMPRNRSHPSH
ncbi:MAG: hypothetical protein J2P36_03115, partial [Ktedonobacteraceae bacterium]|nr:hypothetical protein [Ktedonobacteraceae bacterium]